MNICELMTVIEERKRAVKDADSALVSAEKDLREYIRSLVLFKGLCFGIVRSRMGVPMHVLTNFFCNEQAMKPENMQKLREAIKKRPTAAELATRKRQPYGKRKKHEHQKETAQ